MPQLQTSETTNLISFYSVVYIVAIPLCLLYYAGISTGLLMPFLDAYYPTVLSILLFSMIFYEFFIAILRKRVRLNALDIALFVFVIYSVSRMMFDASVIDAKAQNLKDVFAGLLYFVSFYIIFRNLYFTQSFIYINGTLLIAFTVLLLQLVSSNSLFFGAQEGATERVYISYQLIAAYLMLLSIPVASLIKNNYIRFLLHAITLLILFLNGARTEFFLFLMSVTIIEYYFSSANGIASRALLIMIVLATLVMTDFYASYDFESNRIIDYLSNIGKSSSGLQRYEFFLSGIEDISRSIFFGDMNAYYSGQYIHNILSVWVDLGLLGFVIYSFLIGISFFYLWKYRKLNNKFLTAIGLSLLFPTVVGLLIAKHYLYIVLAASLGIASQAKLCQVRKK